MNNTKTLELEILIAVSQNSHIPADQLSQMFEHKWKLYSPAFYVMVQEGLLMSEINDGLPCYGLTGKGRVRISDLIDQREKDIAVRLSDLKAKSIKSAHDSNSLKSFLHSISRFRFPSLKAKNSELRRA